LGGIVSKLAMLIILRLIVLIYGDAPSAMMLLLSLGILGVITGELAALRATDLRQVLAFSSIGQLGLVAIAFSIPGQAGIIAGIAIALHHAIVKPALFMLTEAWGVQLSRLIGAINSSKLSVFLFVVMALSLIGIPPLPGFWAKFLLVTAALKSDIGQYQMAITVVLIATVIETAYFFKIIRLMFQQKSSYLETPRFSDLAPALSFMVLLFLGLLMLGSLSQGLTGVAKDGANRLGYIENNGLRN
jgi:formate hydrogenlyase subunit 3/multisubunit Na+/H+ antiporter MnhD subunit